MSPSLDFETTSQRIVREISEHGAASRPALARTLRLRPSTLGQRIRALERKSLLESSSGKKVAFNRDYGYVVGIDVGASHLHFAVADFRGEILSDSNAKIRPEDGPRKMIDQIKQGARSLVRQVAARRRSASARAGRQAPRLEALGIGVPSPVDPVSGLVAFANNLPGWKNIDLGRELRKEFRVPVYLENDANMAAIGEHWRGVARGVKNFVFIALGTGIGSGIFVEGKIYRGRTGNAGELYRLNVEWPRWAEDFGDIGYFETHVSGMGIAAAGRRALGAKAQEEAGLAGERDAFFVFESFRQGNPRAREVLEKTFTMLGVCVANLVAVLDPDLIVLGGGVTRGAPELMLSTLDRVVRRIHPEVPPIKLSALEDKAQTYGAIVSALTVAGEAIASRLQ